MSTYFIIGIILFIGIIFVRGFKSLNNLQDEATALVAYVKNAGKGKSSIFDKDKTDEDFYKEKYERVQKACFLLVRFSEKVQGKRDDYRFQIRENGPTFGVYVTVTVGQFMHVITDVMSKIINNMPTTYQKRMKDYLNQPYSPENRQLSEEIEEKIWPKESYMKEWTLKIHQGVIDADYLYTLFK